MTVRILALALTFAAVASPAPAAEPDTLAPGPWNWGSKVGVNVTQSSYTSNWSGGDRGSMAWVVSGQLSAERQFLRRYRMTNSLSLDYGQTSNQVPSETEPGRLVWDHPSKSSDLILFEHLSLFTLEKPLDPYFAFHLDSQFRDLSNPAGEINFNPIKMRETVGFAHVFEKTEQAEFITRIGFGLRQTLGRSFTDSTGSKTAGFSSNDGGFEWNTVMKRPLLDERVLYEGGLNVYAPVFYSKAKALKQFDQLNLIDEEVADYWRVPEVHLTNGFTTHVTKLISVNLLLHFVYNKFDTKADVDAALANGTPDEVARNIRKAGQFKQVLALGVSHSLF